jgi:heat shock protein HslJ
MACPPEQMDLEQKFLAELGKVSGYTFMAGQLALTWQEKERPGLLLFSK